MTPRSVLPAGKTIREKRVGRGWSVEELAKKADLTEKTVGAAEKGTRVSVKTVGALAKWLGVEPDMLLVKDQPNADSGEISMSLKIEGNAKALKESAQLTVLVEQFKALVVLLAKMAEAPAGSIKITGVMSGSVLLRLSMEEQYAIRLLRLFPNFHEFARETIRESPEGEAYLSGRVTEGEEASRIRELLRIVDSVSELRVKAGPDPDDGGSTDPALPAPVTEAELLSIESPPLVENSPEVKAASPPSELDKLRAFYVTGGLGDMYKHLKDTRTQPPSKERDSLIAALETLIDEKINGLAGNGSKGGGEDA